MTTLPTEWYMRNSTAMPGYLLFKIHKGMSQGSNCFYISDKSIQKYGLWEAIRRRLKGLSDGDD